MKKILLLLLLTPLAVAQTPARYDMPALMTTPAQVPVGSLPALLAVTNATISVCGYPAMANGTTLHPGDAVMCTNTITTYTDATLGTACSTTAQLTAPGTSVCIPTTGLQGAFGFWYDASVQSQMTYTVKTKWGVFGPYDISPGGGSGLPVEPGQIQGGTDGQILTKVDSAATWADPTCTTATSSTTGCSKPDNSTVFITGGVLSAEVSGGFQMFVPDPLGTQSVVVPFTVSVNDSDGDPTVCPIISNPTSGKITILGTGSNLGCSNPQVSITWSAAALPAYIPPANVTAIYAVGTVGFSGSAQLIDLRCDVSSTETVLMNQGTGAMAAYSASFTGATGANIGSATCVARMGANTGGANNPIMNIPAIALRVYYTGTAPPASPALNITPCLYINTALNSMGVSAVNLAGTGDCGVTGLLPQANLAPPTQTTVTGTTAGTAVWTQPQQFATWKFASIYLNGYENTTATAQTITLPASFATVGVVATDSGSCAGVTISGATVTLPASMGATQTGLCEIRGY